MNSTQMIRLAATLAAVAGAAALQFATVTAHAHGYTSSEYVAPLTSEAQVQTAADAAGADAR